MTQVEALEHRLAAAGVGTKRNSPREIKLGGFGEDVRAIFPGGPFEGCSIRVWVKETHLGKEEQARRAGELKREVTRVLTEAGILEGEREDWGDLPFFGGIFSTLRLKKEEGRHWDPAA